MDKPVALEKTQAEVPLAVLECTTMFKKSILNAWTAPALLVSTMLDSMDQFGFKLEGVEIKTHTEKLIDYSMVFRRTPPGMTFTLGINKLVIVLENPAWEQANDLIAAMRAGTNALLQQARAEVESQQIALNMHVQLKAKPRHEVTAPLLSPTALRLLDGDVKFPGLILFREKSSIIIDASLAFANAIFVRIVRDHAGSADIQQMADALHHDEEQLFNVLGVGGVL